MALWIAVAGIVARVLVFLVSGGNVKPWEYEDIAQNIVSGRGYGLEYYGTWYRTIAGPPFPYLCAILYLVFGHHFIVVIGAQWVCSASTVLAVYLVSARLFSMPAGLGAAALIAFHPPLVYYDTHYLHALTFDAALFAWSLVGLLALPSLGSAWIAGAIGALHGTAILERTTWVALAVAALFWLGRRSVANRGRIIAAYVLGIAIFLAPWMVRSVSIYGDLTLNAFSAALFWRGNNPFSDGGAFARGRPGVSILEATSEEFRARLAAADEFEQRRIFSDAAKDFIRDHPGAAFRLFLRKLVGFWWFMPQSGLLYPRSYLIAYTIYYAIVAVLAACGIVVTLRRAPPVPLQTLTIVAVLLATSLAQAAFYVEIRHRWSVEPFLLVFASGAVTAWRRARIGVL